ncbi:MAG TPA: ATP-binding protein, partial [Armatimonadota bacterium]
CGLGMNESRVYDMVLCVGEAATNALKHAGGGSASIHRRADALLFVVEDHGSGIEALTLPEVALTKSYSTARSLGMGYKAMISIADRVHLATGPNGTTVAIEMILHPVQRPPILAGIPDTWSD